MSRGEPAVELVCVGTELLSGQLNTHQRTVSLLLKSAGLALGRESSLPDDPALLADELRRALSRSDAVLVSGGLGPTFDDVTREAAAKALGRRLVFRPGLWAGIRRKFSLRGLAVPEQNSRQAWVIEGARVLTNRMGSAPGQLLVARRGGRPRTLVLLPGPASELVPMFSRDVLPALKRSLGRSRHAAHLAVHLSGIPESAADEKLQDLTAKPEAGHSFTILASSGQVDFHATATARTPHAARRLRRVLRRRIYAAVGEHIFGEGDATLESAVGRLLRRRGLTLAVAESCTGGLLGGRLTAVPGSSDYFRGGAIAYADELKTGLLGVRKSTLARHGAVSGPCAREMAEGARRLARASVGLSITGIAGPGGGSRQKPVGLVYVALAGPGRRVGHWSARLSGGRDAVRSRAAAWALHLLHRHISRA